MNKFLDSNITIINPTKTLSKMPLKSKVQVFQSKRNKQWYFRIVGGNGKKVAQSEGYKTRASAIKTVKRIPMMLNYADWQIDKPKK